MSEPHATAAGHDMPQHYQIRIKGHLEPRWADWFDGLTITPEENGDTLLTGPVADQSALYGLLRKVRDMGLPLVAVIHLEPNQVPTPDMNADTDQNRSNKETTR